MLITPVHLLELPTQSVNLLLGSRTKENNHLNSVCLDIRRHSIDTSTASCVEGKEKRSGQRAMNRSKQAAMVSKLAVLLLISWTLVFVRLAEAQQPKKVPRIGLLGVASASALTGQLDAFRQGLRELGYSEGKNIVVEYRYGDGK